MKSALPFVSEPRVYLTRENGQNVEGAVEVRHAVSTPEKYFERLCRVSASVVFAASALPDSPK